MQSRKLSQITDLLLLAPQQQSIESKKSTTDYSIARCCIKEKKARVYFTNFLLTLLTRSSDNGSRKLFSGAVCVTFIILSVSLVLSQSCNRSNSAASKCQPKIKKTTVDATATEPAANNGGNVNPAILYSVHFISGEMCQQLDVTKSVPAGLSMKPGKCPESIVFEGKTEPKSNICPTFEDAGNKVTIATYGEHVDTETLNKYCSDMTMNELAPVTGIELK